MLIGGHSDKQFGVIIARIGRFAFLQVRGYNPFMALPTIFDWLHRLDALRGLPTVYTLALLGAVILMVRDWRVTLAALLGYYLLTGLLFADLLPPHLAFVKVLTGLFVCMILYVTARQNTPTVQPVKTPFRLQLGPLVVANTWMWRLLAALFVALLALYLGQQTGNLLPGMDAEMAHVNTAVFLLVGLGLLQMNLSANIWQSGVGLFLVLTGFELFYNNLEQSPGILAAMTAVTLSVSLAVSYLAQGALEEAASSQ